MTKAKVAQKPVSEMKKLMDIIQSPDIRSALVDDCVTLVEGEVKAKSGLSGLAIKGAYHVIKAIKPGMIKETVDHLLDEFVMQLETFYQSYQNQDTDGAFSDFLEEEKAEVSNQLLFVTDNRAKLAKNQTIKKAYEKLRSVAQDHVEQAVPAIGKMIDKYVA